MHPAVIRVTIPTQEASGVFTAFATHEKNDPRKRHTLHNKLKTLLKKLLLISIITSQNKQNQSPTILRTSIQKTSVRSSEAAHDRLGLMDFGRILVDRTNS